MQATQSLVQKKSYLRKPKLKVADFLSAHLSDLMRLFISDLVAQVGVIETTAIRFCRAIGCNGFQDFSMILALELASPSFGQITLGETEPTAITIFKETILCCELMK
jgi:RpiR family carbohydrate utilization transcriptional regulator